MKFFTPQLYLQFNSPDDQEADRADQAWEAAIQAYHRHLETIRDRMPSQVAKLASLELHDAEILSHVEEVQAGGPLGDAGLPWPMPIPIWSALAIVSVRHEGEILSLIYCLWDHVRTNPVPESWPFSKLKEHWLYDEVDLVSERRGPFLHRILLSSGIELEIPFTTVVIHRLTLPKEIAEEATRQSA